VEIPIASQQACCLVVLSNHSEQELNYLLGVEKQLEPHSVVHCFEVLHLKMVEIQQLAGC
jgi:hypothetical protein